MKQELIDYIRQNRPTKTRSEIDENLIEQGYSQSEINEAWQSIQGEDGVDQKLLEYIKELKGTYTRWAMEQELLKHGYSEEEINNAWVRTEEHAEKHASEVTRPDRAEYWWSFVAFVLGAPILIGLVVRFFPTWSDAASAFIWLAGFAIITNLAAVAIFWNRKREVAKGLLTGVIVSVVLPFIWGVIIIGICSVTGGPGVTFPNRG